MSELVRLNVETKTKNYPIFIGENFDYLLDCFNEIETNLHCACIITDSNVEKIYLNEIMNILQTQFKNVFHFSFEAGENSKNIITVNEIYKKLIENKFDRRSVIFALGGGVVGDIAGFVASTYMRGVPLIQIPTTLLSQVDSSVGGKTGFDYGGMKNIIGSFYQPNMVYININTLKTLPIEQVTSGMAEAIKYGFIKDVQYLAFINHSRDNIKSFDPQTIIALVFGACKNKAAIVTVDETEKGIREILNFGHTFGHALETLTNFIIPHGIAVSIGMNAALYLTNKYEYITDEEMLQAQAVLGAFGLPTGITKNEHITPQVIFDIMKMDKKSTDGSVKLVLLKSIGEAFTCENVDEADIIEAISFILKDEVSEETQK